ncbi:MAG: energy transducer TonB, partial [Myxococcota bacterium]
RVELHASGRVKSYAFVSGAGPFRRAVEETIQSWRFEPHRLGGIAVPTRGTLEFDFTLDE